LTWTTLDYSGRPKALPQKISTPGNFFVTIAIDHINVATYLNFPLYEVW